MSSPAVSCIHTNWRMQLHRVDGCNKQYSTETSSVPQPNNHSIHSHTPQAEAAQLTREEIAREVKRRRNFAIISHPDAGKTTLTEKLVRS
jgi:hypothetical protein